jgi:KDO2-lipid IV(A) lauroyltransferase
MAKDMPTRARHLAEYALYRLFEGAMRHMPWAAAHGMGEAAGRAAYWLDARHRGVALSNLRESDLGLSERDVVQTAKECFAHFGALAFTMPLLLSMDADELARRVTLQGLEHWDAASRGGRGFIGLTGHYGNWEAMALALSASGRPLAVIGRGTGNPFLDSRLRAMRTRFGNLAVEKGGALKGAAGALRRGMGVGFLLDQDARGGGVFATFMGRPASTWPTAAALALRFGLPVVPIFSHPAADGTITVRAERPLEMRPSGNPERDVLDATQIMSDAIEAQVRRLPCAWLWMHRRFKTRPTAQPTA